MELLKENAMKVRISKQKARKLFAEGDKPIYLCPVKMHPAGPFSPACLIFGEEYLQKAAWYKDSSDLWKGTLEKTAWDLMYNNFAYYNLSSCTHEVGRYAAYYVDVP
jgi:hypothetical protein